MHNNSKKKIFYNCSFCNGDTKHYHRIHNPVKIHPIVPVWLECPRLPAVIVPSSSAAATKELADEELREWMAARSRGEEVDGIGGPIVYVIIGGDLSR